MRGRWQLPLPWMLCSAQGVEHFFGFCPWQPLAELHSVERLEGVRRQLAPSFRHKIHSVWTLPMHEPRRARFMRRVGACDYADQPKGSW